MCSSDLITELRAKGEVVIQVRKGEDPNTEEFACDRELFKQGTGWELKTRS